MKLTLAFAVGDDATSPEGAVERGERRVLGFIVNQTQRKHRNHKDDKRKSQMQEEITHCFTKQKP